MILAFLLRVFTPFKMILSLAIGRDRAAAKGIDEKAMPQRMQLEHVRISQVRDRSGK